MDPAFRAESLEAWSRKNPLFDRVSLMDRQGRVLYPPGAPDAYPGLLLEIPQGLWERGGRRHLLVGDQVVLAAVIPGPSGAPVLAALGRSEEAVKREVLAKTLGGLEGPSVLAVLDRGDNQVYASRPIDRAQRVLTVAFGEALPTWRVALYQPDGVSPVSGVRRQAMLFTAAFALLLVVIVLGLGATYRVVRRESEMARLKSDFVANVSHDLKTPLSLIRMFGETLELGRAPDEATRREYYAVITRESERLTRLIDNVLDFSRIESGRQRYDIAPAPGRAPGPRRDGGVPLPAGPAGLQGGRGGGARPARRAHGSGGRQAGAGQPRGQRHQVLGRAPAAGRRRPGRGRPGGHRGRRRGHRHPGGRGGANLREVLSHRTE